MVKVFESYRAIFLGVYALVVPHACISCGGEVKGTFDYSTPTCRLGYCTRNSHVVLTSQISLSLIMNGFNTCYYSAVVESSSYNSGKIPSFHSMFPYTRPSWIFFTTQ